MVSNVTIVNSLSGGKTSSYMAVHYPADVNVFACVCIDYPPAAPKDNAVLRYAMDKLNGNFIASAEDEMSLRIMMQLEQLIGKEIVWVRGKSFDEIIMERGCLPTWLRRFCTTEMKMLPIFEYIYFRYGLVNNNIGFRYDELHRAYRTEQKESVIELLDLFGDLQKVREYVKTTYRKVESIIKDYPLSKNIFGEKQNNLFDVHWANMAYPLIDDRIEHKEVIDFWKVGHPEFVFPEDNNCKMCHYKSKWRLKRNYETNPDILTWASMQEKKIGYNWSDGHVSYTDIFKMSFPELLQFENTSSCDTGYCTD